MRRAVFMVGEADGLPGLRPEDSLAREFTILFLGPGAARADLRSWQRLAADLDVELSASWLVVAVGAASRAPEARVRGAFRGCVAAHSPRGTLRALALVRRAAAEDRILTDYRTVAKKCEALRAKGSRIVFTNGVFDLFHVGHLRLLQTARALGDALVVGINSDESAARLKGRTRPVVPQFARAQLVAGVRGVDFCVVFEEDDPRELLRVVRPDLLVKGSEYSLRGVVGRRIVESYGGRVALIPHVSGWSTSSLLGKARRNG